MIDDGIDRDALLRVFLVEAEENLASMEESLVALERTPEDGALLATIFRAAHTLKGNCASVGLDSVVELAHVAEDLLHELRARRFPITPDLITLLLQAADALKTLVPQAAATPEAPPSPDGALVAALRQSASTGRVPVPAAAAPAPDEPRMPETARTTTVRVQTRKLDLLLDAISELTIARGRVRAVAGAGTEVDDALDHLDVLTDHIQDLVVEKNISAVGGSLNIESELGRGTTFTIRLPLTVAVPHGLTARVGPELYIVPLPAVAECLDLPPEAPAAAMRHA